MITDADADDWIAESRGYATQANKMSKESGSTHGHCFVVPAKRNVGGIKENISLLPEKSDSISCGTVSSKAERVQTRTNRFL